MEQATCLSEKNTQFHLRKEMFSSELGQKFVTSNRCFPLRQNVLPETSLTITNSLRDTYVIAWDVLDRNLSYIIHII